MIGSVGKKKGMPDEDAEGFKSHMVPFEIEDRSKPSTTPPSKKA
jgi:hypothetical protein